MRRFQGAAVSVLVLVLAWGGAAKAGAAIAPDLNGVWLIDQNIRGLRTEDGQLPPMTAWAQQLYRQHLKDRRSGNIDFDMTESLCAAPGVPRIMTLPYPFEILQNDTQVALLFGWNSLSRFIPIEPSGAAPAELDFPSAVGSSSAHWEGRTLVVQTISRSEETLLDADGLPNSNQLRIVERWTLASDGQRLEVRIRIEDSKAYARPWETTVTYHKLNGAQIAEDVCVTRLLEGKPLFEPGRWGFK